MTAPELAAARAAAGLSRRQLALLMGVYDSTIWRWETGRSPIGHLEAAELHRVLQRSTKKAKSPGKAAS